MATTDEIIELRGHHGMCFQYYVGIGYSDGFTKNMTRYKNLLEEQDPLIRLKAGTDHVCAACPNNLDGSCQSPEKVKTYDRQVLARCNLKEGQLIRWSAFRDLVKNEILLPGRREEICKDCEWSKLCR